MEDSTNYAPHANKINYFFKNDNDMDFHFGNLILGSAVNHGAEIGEAFYAASQIKDGDAASWQEQWYTLAQRVEARGDNSWGAGHIVSAPRSMAASGQLLPVFLDLDTS